MIFHETISGYDSGVDPSMRDSALLEAVLDGVNVAAPGVAGGRQGGDAADRSPGYRGMLHTDAQRGAAGI